MDGLDRVLCAGALIPPTLILELGRGIGSSTSLFRYWGRGEVVSICNTSHWQDTTAPALAEMFPNIAWRDVDARVGDILDTDYESIIRGHPRVLVLWDAHGRDIAGAVIERLIPHLPRANIIVAHDMRDARYFPNPEQGVVWKRAGHMLSNFEQIEPIASFCESTGARLHSASHALRLRLLADAKRELKCDGVCYWHYFSAPSSARRVGS